MRVRTESLRALMAALALICAGPAFAEEKVEALLDRMTAAVENLHYEGTFVYSSGAHMETVEIVHGHVDGVRRERLMSLTGERREIIRNNHELICIWPDSETVLHDQRRSRFGWPAALSVGRLDDLGRYYGLRFDQTRRRVAGHSCREVLLLPADHYRYGHRYCIESVTAMPLRAEMFDPRDGEILERFLFTSIRFPDHIPASRFEPVTGGEGFRMMRIDKDRSREEIEGDMGWAFESPPGFVLTRAVKRYMADDHEPVQHMVVTDGLASVSVFIARAGADDPPGALQTFGPMRTLSRHYGEWLVTTVGEVPEATVRMIAESMRHGDAH